MARTDPRDSIQGPAPGHRAGARVRPRMWAGRRATRTSSRPSPTPSTSSTRTCCAGSGVVRP